MTVFPRYALRRLAAVVSVGLVASLVAVAGPLPAAQAAAGLSLTKSGPSSVLADGAASYALTAANPGSAPEYNVTFRDVLPAGVTYVGGSTSPSSAGEPQVITDPTTHAQTLIWSNVTDLQVGDSFALGFSADTDPAVLPVGATFVNSGSAYSNTDPRRVPTFSATGTPTAGSYTETASATTSPTVVSALKITKAEPSPEAELLRGVHLHATVYTLTVNNTTVSATDGVVVTDYLPASLEFLGCGGVDNSAGREYPGAPSLTATPAVTPCVVPASVTTVSDPPAQGATTYPPGVYTRVQWDLGTLAPGAVVTLRYAAGIPLRANEAAFPAGSSASSVANLDNNTGASTRETASETGATNVARASGTYTGALVPGGVAATAADTTHTVTIEDVRMRKSASSSTFRAGGRVTYTVTIDASEYVSAGGVVVTDVLPNGLCPLVTQGVNYAAPNGTYCTGEGVLLPSVSVNGGAAQPVTATVTTQADGTFKVVFSALSGTIPANGTAVLTYWAGMQQVYTAGPHAGDPTSSGDTFTNNVSLTATTTPIAGTGETGPQTVGDASSATLTTDGLSIDKTIGPRSAFPRATDPPCGTDGVGYGEPSAFPAADTRFRKGDLVCFKLRVNFPSTAYTRNPVVTDFLPVGTEYVSGSAVATSNNQRATSTLATTADSLTWTIGAVSGSGLSPDLGAVFEWVFAVRVTDAAPVGSPDILGNAMKLRAEDSAGHGRSYRDLVDFQIVPAVPIGVVKGVQSIDTPAAGPNGLNSNVDGLPVREGSKVTFRIDLTNKGTPGGIDGYGAGAFDLWDVLPAGITCADISSISGPASNPATPVIRCTNPGDPNQPSFALNASRSAIRWIYTADPAFPNAPQGITPGQSFTYTYVMTIPSPTSAGFVFTNTAAVRSYNAVTNVPPTSPGGGGTATYYPQSNIDTTIPVADQEAPPASDTSDVRTPAVSVGKVGVTSINETNNNTPNQATIGELVTYRYAVTVPAGTAVFDGALSDALPTGFVLQPNPIATVEFCPVAPTPTGPDPLPACASPGTVPGNVSLDPANGTLTIAGVFDNATASPARFLVTATVRVTSDALTAAQNAIGGVNTARFTSVASPGGAAIPAVTRTYTVNVRQPNPTILKTNNKPTFVVGGQTVTYTVSVANLNTDGTVTNRPPLHDAFVVDCLPSGLTFAAYGAGPGLTPVAGTGTNGCATGTTRLVWALGDVPASTTPTTRTYAATVDLTAVGGDTYTNVATLTGSTLNDGKPTFDALDNPVERVYSRSDTSSVTVAGSGIVKTVDEPIRTIGQVASFTIVTAIPPNINFYGASVLDRVPAGFSAPSNATYSCVDAVTNLDCGTIGTPLASAPQADGSTVYGFTVGDLLSSPNIRRETVTYTATVLDVPSNTAGTARTNSATTAWFLTPGHVPTSAGGTFDRNGATDTATVTIVEPKLSISKQVTDTTPDTGQVFRYNVLVANASGSTVSDAYNTVVVDHVPLGVVVDFIPGAGVLTGADPVRGGGTITWPASDLAGPLNPGDVYNLAYFAHLAPSSTLTAAALVNTATVQSYESLPSGGRVYAGTSTTATVTPQFPRLLTAKAATGGAPAYIGTPYTWTVTSTNTGGAEAFAVDVSDTLPSNWVYSAGSARISINGATATAEEPTITSIFGRSFLRWTSLADLMPGEKVTVTYQATPQAGVVTTPGVGATVPHTNTANSFGRDATDATGNALGDYGDQPATASTRIDSADVRLDKAHLGTPVAGAPFTWTLTVSNAGPDTAVGPFTVTDALEAPTTFVSAAGTGWTCAHSGADVSCTRASPTLTLAPGATFPVINVTVLIPADVASGTTMHNAATAGARTHDPLPANNTDTDTAVVTTAADLAIAKSHTGTILAGQDATYTIDVVNNGPSVSRSPITVVDTLPPGSTFVSSRGLGWSACQADTPTAGRITCVRAADLGPGLDAPQLVVVVAIPSSQSAQVVNTATVTGTTPDPVPGNNTDDDRATPAVSADLSIQKANIGSVVAGTDAIYRLTVDNTGPSDAASPVRITDTLPAGLTYLGSTDRKGVWTCSAVLQVVTCDLAGPLPADPDGLVSGDAIVDLVVRVASDVTGTIVNTATVGSPTPDPNLTNNTDVDSSAFVGESDLQIVKSHSGNAVAGRPFTWTLTVTNNGPSDSPGDIVVSDALPEGTTFVSATGTGWTCGSVGRLVTCTRTATLVSELTDAVAAVAPPISVVVDVDPSAGPAVLTNIASVDGPDVDPVPGNNVDTDRVTVDDLADVTILKQRNGPLDVAAGGTTSFTLTVTNSGPSTADALVVTDRLPAGLVPVSAAGDGWTCPTPLGQLVACTRASQRPSTVAAPFATTILVAVRVESSVADQTTLTNTALVSTSTPGDDPANNTSSDTVHVVARADLVLRKAHADAYDRPAAGTEIVYDVAVRNDGPSDAQPDITVVDTLPVGLTFVSSTGPWTCTPAAATPTGQDVTCLLDGGAALVAGTSAPALAIRASLAADLDTGLLRNSAEVSSPTTDPVPDNNTDTDPVRVTQSADLEITKTHVGTAHVGSPLGYTLSVVNHGPSLARQVSVTDALPAGLRYVSATGTGWTCAATGGTVTCARTGTLAPGATAEPITVTVTVLAAAYPSVTNTATVAAQTPDPVPANNTDADAVTVPALVDLTIAKSHTGPVQVGSRASYAIVVTNNGPTADPGPQTVVDTLPTGLRFVSGAGVGWACSAAGRAVTCVHTGAITVGASVSFTLTVTVLPSAFPGVVNTATVSTPSEESDSTNNTATDPTTVHPLVELALVKKLGSYDGTTRLATWVIAVTNNGPNVSQAPIVVTDVLPAGLTYVSATGPGWSCGVNGQTVTCTHTGQVPVGSTVAFQLVSRSSAADGTVIENQAFLTGHLDHHPANDRSTASFTMPNTGGLVQTGADAASLLLLALTSFMVGGVLLTTGRRRRPGSGPAS